MKDPSPGVKVRILLSGWHFGAMLLFLRSSRKLEQFAGTRWQKSMAKKKGGIDGIDGNIF